MRGLKGILKKECSACVDGSNARGGQYHVLLLGVSAYVAQKGALARAGLAREKYRAVGVLYHGPGVLKLRVVEIDVL